MVQLHKWVATTYGILWKASDRVILDFQDQYIYKPEHLAQGTGTVRTPNHCEQALQNVCKNTRRDICSSPEMALITLLPLTWSLQLQEETINM